ncbi:hypothetical protein DVH24_002578 [Malus domestica]|uniref:RRM domain-containing protein n=1 Tax=Malus domestica TaxID=3750 RepID=A0A498K2X5_MALDO|nr:hypothetical protein DVH24_002578 [Malus domestica]
MLRLKPNRLRTFITTGEELFVSFAAKLLRNKALSCNNKVLRSIHSSSSEDDTFTELGSPVPEAPTHPRKLKLMTEKPEPYLVVVRSFSRSIDPLEEKEEVTIRITNINSETTDSAVHSMCTSCGGLEGLVRTKEDAVDALFSVKDNAGIKRIIKRLNQTIVNGHKWSAGLHGRDSSPEATSKQSNANYDLRLEISRQLADVRREVTRKTVLTRLGVSA